jgi:hypothetical protein
MCLAPGDLRITVEVPSMYFRDFYHHHPHGVPIGGLILLLLVVILVVVLTRNSKD